MQVHRPRAQQGAFAILKTRHSAGRRSMAARQGLCSPVAAARRAWAVGTVFATLAMSALPAVAQTVTGPQFNVSFSGLPAGLSVTLDSFIVACNAGQGEIPAGSAPMQESTLVLYEVIGNQVRPVVHTSYAAPIRPTFSAVVAPCNPAVVGSNVVFRARVAGRDSWFQTAFKTATLPGSRLDIGPFTLSTRLEGKTGAARFGTTAIGPVPRGVIMSMTVKHQSPFGPPVRPSLEFLAPAQPDGLFQISAVTARLFLRDDGKRCIANATSTVCSTGTGAIQHAGVELQAIRHPSSIAQTGTDFQFKLLPEFPTGAMSISAAADDPDLATYRVDGRFFRSLNLLNWASSFQSISVQ